VRLLRLGLDRYGHFEDRVLDFDPKARLVVVHGANEAGKSTALAAVADALFDIDRQTRFGFRHAMRDLRLSATLESAGGARLAFARLKRDRAKLVDPARDDAPLADDALAPFLAGCDKPTFLKEFGLDQKRLRAGGEELLKGGGDLARALLAAAPGLARVGALRDEWAKTAGEIFNPDRKVASHAFYRADAARHDAVKAMRAQEVRVEEAKALRASAQEAQGACKEARDASLAAEAALARARRLQTCARDLAALDAETQARAALGDLPACPPDLPQTARAALDRLDRLEESFARAAREEEAARAARENIADDPAALALEDEIERLNELRASVRKELDDLPRRRREADEARAQLDRLATGLSLTDAAALRARMPGAPALARADATLHRWSGWAGEAQAQETARADFARRRATLRAEREALGPLSDPTPLLRRLARLDGAQERAHALRLAEARAAETRRRLDESARRLPFGAADAEALAALPLPPLALTESRLAALREARAGEAQASAQRLDLDERLARLDASLARLRAGSPAPTQAALAEARAARDALWAGLRPLAFALREAGPLDAAEAAALDRALAQADRLADDRQTATARLAALERDEREHDEAGAARKAAAAREEDARAASEAARKAFADLWTNLPAPAPDAAPAALRDAANLVDARAALRAQQAEDEARRPAVTQDRAEAAALRAELGLPPAAPDAPLGDLRAAVEARAGAFQQARDLDRALAALERDAAAAQAAETTLTERHAALESERRALLPALALREEAGLEEARGALAAWREAATLIEALATAERRVEGIERDRDAFAAEAAALAARAGEATGEDAIETARRLRQRLERARVAATQAAGAQKALAARRAEREAAGRDRDAAALRVAELCATLGAPDPARLRAALERIDAARESEARRDEARRRFLERAEGEDETAIRAALAGLDADALARAVSEADFAHAQAKDARDRAVAQATRCEEALAALDARQGAADAAQAEQDALADMAQAIERFSRAHVGARLLTLAIERYRERRQSPILERAGAAFATLTGGAWQGLGVDYDSDPPRLAARRDGRPHGVEALSEGAADQLFLALRVAALEARAGEPLPFLADDLFVAFDEARTQAGLRLLAELGELMQVIVFTHHRHVADGAREVLGDGARIVAI
jgi:uncharacterized protein YhaN